MPGHGPRPRRDAARPPWRLAPPPARRTFRGAHYKPEVPDRNDADWLKTTRAAWTPEGPAFSDGPVDTSLLPPGPRRYDEPTPLASRPAGR